MFKLCEKNKNYDMKGIIKEFDNWVTFFKKEMFVLVAYWKASQSSMVDECLTRPSKSK